MKPACNVATLIERYFTERLMRQRNVSPNTIASYRDTFRLLFTFAQARLRNTNGQRHRLSPRFRWPRKYDSLFPDQTIPWTGERHERGDCDHP